MTHLVLMDTEQGAILRDVAKLSVDLLGHRLTRADPDGIVSASITLQKLKMQQLLAQFDLPPLPSWSQMPQHHRQTIARMAAILASGKAPETKAIAFEKLFTAILSSRSEAVAHALAQADKTQSAPDTPPSRDEEKGA